MSDHYPVCFTRRLPKLEKKKKHLEIIYRDFKNFDEKKFLQDLCSAPFFKVNEKENVNDALDLFYDIFLQILDRHAKLVTKRVKTQTKPVWLTPEINEARYNRDYFHHKKDIQNFKKWRNKVIELIKEAKINYYSVAVENNHNTGDIWRSMKQLIPKGSHSLPNKLNDGQTTAESTSEIVNLFNKFYTELSDNIITDSFNEPINTFDKLKCFTESKLLPSQLFEIQPATEEEVFNLLNKLNVNKSAGIDTLGPRILKIAAGIITKPITSMINMSIFTGVFPEKLKTAKVTPIYKKGDKSDPSNYRPISILPTISKLFERHITTQMYDYLKENDLLMKEQSGFRKSHSCQTALTKLTEKWITDIDNGNMTGVSLLDFRKAFDLVNHKILIDKMKYYNFTNETLNWLESYLSNRTQTVHIGNVSSNLSAITCGVPQGSVLGPVLFLLYINDLPLHVKNSRLDLFADDATLHKANNNLLEIERDMNEDMDHISAWCKENRMVINESKTKCILVGARQKISRLPTTTLSLKVNDKLIDNLTSDKLLGVYIDNYLQFDKHIDEVCKAITQKIALLRRIKKYLGLQHRVLYYNAYILPSIDYCLTIYGNASKSHLDRILKLQKSAARVIMDAPPDTPSQPLFDELDWLNIYDRCIFNKGVLLFKIFNNQAPSYLLDLFSETSNSNYQLRSITDRHLSIPRHKTEFYKRSLQYSGVILLNELPTHIRLSNSLPTFKNSLLKYLKEKRNNTNV
ncbi:hypothetical protein FSP39_000043 [Pinctada imbricata]|uniref:Reverse transcriptase domain-containing protein n=1 Tax=Pinctada imbricata TaxID=66713 RepID=A0AA88XY50_PINIB|nr:hypothetical protein FSP39_000043 [Pinctada imbricata]